jgi:3-phenylpropionate/cinnamic acid dioxygenase small subunit
MTQTTTSASPSLERLQLQHEIEQFLYTEAMLLDERRIDEWFELLADDLEYWMPVRTTRARGEEALEFAPFGGAAFFDDDKSSMAERVRKLHTGYAWSEDPPSRTRHCVSNVRILAVDGDDVTIGCNFILYRSRLASDEDLWVGRREDALRRTDSGWSIRKRHIYLDHVSLTAKNLSIFF